MKVPDANQLLTVIIDADQRCAVLKNAIIKTLDENAHLADGEECTLLALKIALREIGMPWDGDLQEGPDSDELALFDAAEARAINSGAW